MVTSFNARLVSLANKCNPLVGNHRNPKKRARIIDGATVLGEANIQHTKRTHSTHDKRAHGKHATMEGYYVARTHPNDTHPNDGAPPAKRRRQLQELQFAAATVESALAAAGRRAGVASITARRRERALPLGSVDLGLARVVTSREFDAEEGLGGVEEAPRVDAAPTTVPHRVSMGYPTEGSGGNTNADDEAYDVAAMHMMGTLLQSTRHLYAFSSTAGSSAGNNAAHAHANLTHNVEMCQLNQDSSNANLRFGHTDDVTGAFVTANNADAKLSSLQHHPNMMTEGNGQTTNVALRRHTGYAPANNKTEDNSEGLSSWTPSSSCGEDEEGARRKRIDDDNQSSSEDTREATASISSGSAEDNGDGDTPEGCGCGPERREGWSGVEDGPLAIVG